jgi:hypothetical protein
MIEQNILDVFDRATDAEVMHGMTWYVEANAIALELGHGDVRKGAALIAVTSPMQKWDRNIKVARHAVEYGYPYPGMKNIMGKVIRILEGENPDTVVSGEKVTSFYNNIIDPLGDHVTVDRHAIDIALGVRHTDESRPSMSKTRYKAIADAYTAVAKGLEIAPLQLQAITWVTWRREQGIK